jgi:hypothetical protein
LVGTPYTGEMKQKWKIVYKSDKMISTMLSTQRLQQQQYIPGRKKELDIKIRSPILLLGCGFPPVQRNRFIIICRVVECRAALGRLYGAYDRGPFGIGIITRAVDPPVLDFLAVRVLS